jgi:hypothetical protein
MDIGPRKQRRGNRERSSIPAIPSLCLDLDTLMAKKRDADPSMIPPAPVLPEERSRPDDHGMQQHADLTRLCR